MTAIVFETIHEIPDLPDGEDPAVGPGLEKIRLENLDLCPTYRFENGCRFFREEVSGC